MKTVELNNFCNRCERETLHVVTPHDGWATAVCPVCQLESTHFHTPRSARCDIPMGRRYRGISYAGKYYSDPQELADKHGLEVKIGETVFKPATK
jgi:ribosomal protein L37E